MSSKSLNKLWINAGILFTAAFVLKQFIWYKVSAQVKTIRKDENDVAVQALENAIKEGKKYTLPPLTSEQRRKLNNLTKEEKEFFFTTDQDLNELEYSKK